MINNKLKELQSVRRDYFAIDAISNSYLSAIDTHLSLFGNIDRLKQKNNDTSSMSLGRLIHKVLETNGEYIDKLTYIESSLINDDFKLLKSCNFNSDSIFSYIIKKYNNKHVRNVRKLTELSPDDLISKESVYHSLSSQFFNTKTNRWSKSKLNDAEKELVEMYESYYKLEYDVECIINKNKELTDIVKEAEINNKVIIDLHIDNGEEIYNLLVDLWDKFTNHKKIINLVNPVTKCMDCESNILISVGNCNCTNGYVPDTTWIHFNESEIYWLYDNKECKSKLDKLLINFDKKIIRLVDYKSTQYPKNEWVHKQYKQYKYNRQLSFYIDAVKWYLINNNIITESELDLFNIEYYVVLLNTKFSMVELCKISDNDIEVGKIGGFYKTSAFTKYNDKGEIETCFNNTDIKTAFELNLINEHSTDFKFNGYQKLMQWV